jgi:hypothetical protein
MTAPEIVADISERRSRVSKPQFLVVRRRRAKRERVIRVLIFSLSSFLFPTEAGDSGGADAAARTVGGGVVCAAACLLSLFVSGSGGRDGRRRR